MSASKTYEVLTPLEKKTEQGAPGSTQVVHMCPHISVKENVKLTFDDG